LHEGAGNVLLLIGVLSRYYSRIVKAQPIQFFIGAALLCAGLLAPLTKSAQTLQVSPNPAMVDEPVALRASDLQPGERVTIRGELTDGADTQWKSENRFVADAQGRIDTSRQAPVEGSYKSISGPGAIWSMLPVDKHAIRYQPPSNLSVQHIRFQLIRNSQQIASTQLEQVRLAEGVRQVRLEGKLHGVLFLPAVTGPRPGVLVLGGFEGGAPLDMAAWLASHGYAALALAYFHYEDLPTALKEIPLEYFGSAVAWMMDRPEILRERIAVVGTSRGGELALQLGSMYGQLKAIVAYSPANVRLSAGLWYYAENLPLASSWMWHGEPLAYMPGGFMQNPSDAPSPTIALRAAIGVEQTRGALLLICGEGDGVWPSSAMTAAVVDRLKRARYPYPVAVLKYPDAGHQAGQPEIIPAWRGTLTSPVTGFVAKFGGTSEGNTESTLDAGPKVIKFLRENLDVSSASHEAGAVSTK
jgi:dienelactone hydrolase